MENEKEQVAAPSSSLTYYLIGAGVLVLIVGGAYVLRPKSTSPVTPAVNVVTPVVTTPATGPITGLACEQQWYNTVNYMPKYFLSVAGADLMTSKKVMCDFSVSVSGTVVATSSAQSGLTEAVGRGGGTFRCDSKELALDANVPIVVDVTLKNDKNETATCTQTFVLPPP